MPPKPKINQNNKKKKNNNNKTKKSSNQMVVYKQPSHPMQPRMPSGMASDFYHCVAGPVDTNSQGMGVPDGDDRPSFTIDHRQLYTITPSAGYIKLALLAGAYGGVAIIQGVVNTTLPKFASSAGTTMTTATTQTFTCDGTKTPFIFPYSALTTDIGQQAFGPYQVNAFRTIVQVAQLCFTGSSLANQGCVSVAKVPLAFSDTNATSNSGDNSRSVTALLQMNSDLPTSSSALVNQGRVTTVPASSGFTIRNIPTAWAYTPITPNTSMLNAAGSSYLRSAICEYNTNALSIASYNPGINPQIAPTIVIYEGLDSTASVAINIRTCNQYTVTAASPVAPFTRPSPRSSPTILQRIGQLARSLPLVEIGKNLLRSLPFVGPVMGALGM